MTDTDRWMMLLMFGMTLRACGNNRKTVHVGWAIMGVVTLAWLLRVFGVLA